MIKSDSRYRHLPNKFKSFIYCVPSRPRALTKVKVKVKVKGQRMVGPLKGPKEESQQIDRLGRRQGGASPR